MFIYYWGLKSVYVRTTQLLFPILCLVNGIGVLMNVCYLCVSLLINIVMLCYTYGRVSIVDVLDSLFKLSRPPSLHFSPIYISRVWVSA